MTKTVHLFLVSLLIHKMGGEERVIYLRGRAYFKFWLIGGALVRRGCLFEEAGSDYNHGLDYPT